MSQEWGDKIVITDGVLKAQIEAAKERMLLEILNPSPRTEPAWTFWDRVELAWEVLRGRVTWDDIG